MGRLVPNDYPMRKEIVKLLIKRLAKTFGEFNSLQDRIYVIDSIKTLDVDTNWDNELHPNGNGFRKLVHGTRYKVLRQAGVRRLETGPCIARKRRQVPGCCDPTSTRRAIRLRDATYREHQ